MNKAYLYLYRRDAGSSIRSRPQPNGQAVRCGGGSVWRRYTGRRAAQTIIKNFYKRNFSILIFFLRLGCRYAPPPRRPVYPQKTSSRRNVESTKRFCPFSLRLGDSTFRRQSVSAAKRLGVSSARYDRIGPSMRCGARIGGSAAYPNRRNAETPISCSTWNAETPKRR